MQLFNSYSGQIETFKTIKQNEARIYVCGITPYDTTHLGHAFVYVTFDALVRFLKFKGYKVSYTQNVTDIDDDILKRAKRDGKNWQELGNYWTGHFLKDLKALNVQMPDHYIKATEAMQEIIEMIQILLHKGFAYEVNGNVYFEVAKFPEYGKLSKLPIQEMLELLKERGGNPEDQNKKAPLDFILWQKSATNEPFWDSPFSKGRPGWHIECSAMIKKTLGDQIDPFDKLRVNGERSRTIDIHGGGVDLIYPHHESELAQSESAFTKSPFVKYWMHVGMVSYKGEKISKSLGNLILISDLLKKYSPNAIRLMLLLNHYREPWEYTEEKMQKAQEIMNKLQLKFRITPLRWEAKLDGMSRLLSDLEKDFNTESAIKRFLKESEINPASSKAGFQLLGFKFS